MITLGAPSQALPTCGPPRHGMPMIGEAYRANCVGVAKGED
jgi:hypothetical protein